MRGEGDVGTNNKVLTLMAKAFCLCLRPVITLRLNKSMAIKCLETGNYYFYTPGQRRLEEEEDVEDSFDLSLSLYTAIYSCKSRYA